MTDAEGAVITDLPRKGGANLDLSKRADLLADLQPLVVRTVRLVVGSGSAVAEDAAQEALLEIARSLPQLTNVTAAPAWAMRIATRVALRTAKREARLSLIGVRAVRAPETIGGDVSVGMFELIEDKLPELLQELELRAVEDDEREAKEKRQAEERQRQWELAMERARQRFIEAHRAKVLRAQIAARQEAQVMSAYLAELKAAHGDSAESDEWIEWVRDFVTRLDPLQSPPSMPAEPEISREDLKPFLPGGMNPYGPQRW